MNEMQDTLFPNDAYRYGKIDALQILYDFYLDRGARGVVYLTIDDLLKVINTLILNLKTKEVKEE